MCCRKYWKNGNNRIEGWKRWMNKRIFSIAGIVLGFILTSWWVLALIGGRDLLLDEWTRKPVELVSDTVLYDFFRFMTQFGSESFMYPFTVVMAIVLIILYRDWLPGLIFAG